MAVIKPFRAWRYNEEVITDLNKKFSPLFDVVSKEEIEALYRIPNNSIHLSVPQSLEDALDKLEEWKYSNIIQQDSLPAIYIYYQQFSLYGEQKNFTRKGFISLVKLGENDGDEIVLHENTITASVNDRTDLLEKTLLNVAPTHGLYEDKGRELESLMDHYMEHPLYEYIDYQGVMNKLSIVQNRKDIELFIETMRNRKIYLADGHHRLASSISLQQKMKAEDAEVAADSFLNYHLMYCTNIHADDLRILPIHRVVKTTLLPTEIPSLLDKLSHYFDIIDVSNNRIPLFKEISGMKRSFGMAIGGKHFILKLKDEIDPQSDNLLELPASVKSLDYAILHYFVLDKVLKMPWAAQGSREEIEYVKDYYTAINAAREFPKRLAFIMNGLSLEKMMEVCDAGAIMPQKSTYFYPKVVCGLLFASIDDKENNTSFDASFRLPSEEKVTR